MKMRITRMVPALLALAYAQAPAATFNVDTAAELQTALNDAAANGEADTINLAAGTYNTSDNGPGTFIYAAAHPPDTMTPETFSLTISGAGAGSTIIDGNGARQALQIDLMPFRGDPDAMTPIAATDDSGVTVTVQDLTVRNGVTDTPACVFDPDGDGDTTFDGDGCVGGGIAIEANQAAVVVQSCELLNNAGIDGGGLQVHSFGGTIDVDDCIFSGNAALEQGMVNNGGNGNGGGARLHTSAAVSVTNSDFDSNLASDLTADQCSAGGPDGCGGAGGGLNIHSTAGPVTLADNTFTANTASDQVDIENSGGAANGGGLRVTGAPDAELTGNAFVGNSASWDGGGAAMKLGTASIVGNAFEDNSSGVDGLVTGGLETVGDGGGLKVRADLPAFSDNTFSGNTAAGGDGGGAHVRNDGNGGAASWADNEFVANVAENRQGSTRQPGEPDKAAAGDADDGVRAVLGFDDEPKPGDGGGAQVFAGGMSDLTRNLFKDNTAEGAGGGLSFRSSSSDADVTASFFIGNESQGNTSGFEVDAFRRGGAGGFFFTDTATLNVVNNTFCFNDATGGGTGGGATVYAETDGSAVGNIYNNNIWANSASAGGGDLFVQDLDPDQMPDPTGTEINLFSNNFADFTDACVDDTGCSDALGMGNNLAVDPGFISMETCRIGPNSPLVGMADLGAPGLPETDFDGNPISATIGAVGAAFVPIAVPALSIIGIVALLALLVVTARHRLGY